MEIKIISKDRICDIELVLMSVQIRSKNYSVWVMLDKDNFVNAEIATDDLHEIIYSESSFENMFPGVIKLAKAA